MLIHPLRESRQPVVEVVVPKDTTAALPLVLKFLYNGHMDLDMPSFGLDKVIHLWRLSDFLQLKCFTDAIEQEVSVCLSPL